MGGTLINNSSPFSFTGSSRGGGGASERDCVLERETARAREEGNFIWNLSREEEEEEEFT